MGIFSMFGSIGSSIIGAGSAAAQQAKEQKFNREEAEKARQFNAAEAEKAREFNADEAQKNRDYQTSEREATQDWNLEQWNRENEYNSPAEQLKRAIAAGINPNSLEGMGNSTAGSVQSSAQSGSAASGPAASGPAATTPSIASTLGDLLGNSVNSAISAAKTRSETEGIDIDNAYKPAQYKAELKKLDKETDKVIADTDLSRQQQKNLKQTFDRVEKMTPLEIDALSKGLTKLDEEVKVLQEQQKTQQKERDVMDTDMQLKGAEKDLIESQAEGQNTQNEILDNELIIKQAAATMAETTGYVLGADDIYNLYMAQKKGVDTTKLLNGYVQLKMTEAGIDASKQEYINERDQFWKSKYSYWYRPSNVYESTANAIGTLPGGHGNFKGSNLPTFYHNKEKASTPMMYGNDDVVRIGPYFYKRM